MQYNGSHDTGNEHDGISDFLMVRMKAWINLCHAKSPITTALILFLSCPV